MAVRIVNAFERQLQTLVADGVVGAEPATVGSKIVRDLPLEVLPPYPLPGADCGLVLEWSLKADLAELEISPDLTIAITVEIDGDSADGKIGDLAGPEGQAFLGMIHRRFVR